MEAPPRAASVKSVSEKFLILCKDMSWASGPTCDEPVVSCDLGGKPL